MTKNKANFIIVAFFSIICGLVIVHVFQWHYAGKYIAMAEYVRTGRAGLVALYTVGLMVMLGLSFGLLIQKVMDLHQHCRSKTRHFDGEDKLDK